MSRCHKPGFRADDNELKVLNQKAFEAGMNTSDYLRASAFNKKIIVIKNGEDFKELIKELKKIGNNINQLTTMCHQGKIVVVQEKDLKQVKEKVNEIWHLLNLLTAKINLKLD